jgi:hypothetical protein
VYIAFTEAPNEVDTILGKLEIVSMFDTSMSGRLPVSVIGRDLWLPLSVLTLQPTVLPKTVLGIALKNRVWLFKDCHTFLPKVEVNTLSAAVVVKIASAVPVFAALKAFDKYSGPNTDWFSPLFD